MDKIPDIIPTDILDVVVGYSGKGFVCDKGELYLHYAFHFMNQYEKELCKQKTIEYAFGSPSSSYLLVMVPSNRIALTREEQLEMYEYWSWGERCPERRKELDNLKMAMKYIKEAKSDDPFIRFRVGKKVQRSKKVRYLKECMGTVMYQLDDPFIETEETLRAVACMYHRHLEAAIYTHKSYDPSEHPYP